MSILIEEQPRLVAHEGVFQMFPKRPDEGDKKISFPDLLKG
jgi:hypothetical protein